VGSSTVVACRAKKKKWEVGKHSVDFIVGVVVRTRL